MEQANNVLNEPLAVYLLVVALGITITVIGFFLRQIYNKIELIFTKFDDINKTVTGILTQLATITEKVETIGKDTIKNSCEISETKSKIIALETEHNFFHKKLSD